MYALDFAEILATLTTCPSASQLPLSCTLPQYFLPAEYKHMDQDHSACEDKSSEISKANTGDSGSEGHRRRQKASFCALCGGLSAPQMTEKNSSDEASSTCSKKCPSEDVVKSISKVLLACASCSAGWWSSFSRLSVAMSHWLSGAPDICVSASKGHDATNKTCMRQPETEWRSFLGNVHGSTIRLNPS